MDLSGRLTLFDTSTSDAATVTRTIQRLERAGFVRRSAFASDRCVVVVEATPASQSLRQRVQEIWEELEALTLADMSSASKAVALTSLSQLEANLLKTEPFKDARA